MECAPITSIYILITQLVFVGVVSTWIIYFSAEAKIAPYTLEMKRDNDIMVHLYMGKQDGKILSI